MLGILGALQFLTIFLTPCACLLVNIRVCLWARIGWAIGSFFFFNLFIFGCVGSFLLRTGFLFSSCGEQGLLFVAVRGLLIAVAPLVVEHGL